MGVVAGPLRTVASEIAEVRNVKVKGMFDRPEDGGITLDDYAKVDYTDGVVTFEALPGAAVLKLDRVNGRVTTIKMIIPEEDCTLEDAVKAGGVVDHVDSVRLTQIVHMIETTERNATNAATSAGVAKGHADRAAEENSAAQSAAVRAAGSEANAKESEDNAAGSEEVASQAASAANVSAGTATSKADEAGQYASSAQADAQTATTKAGEANTSANTASNHASAADTARQGAVAAQGLAETARDEAETKVQDALDVALPTKADKEHEHTTAQVTGLDTALADKAAQATLNTRVPENLALRLDTTVGTRIFAGDTMIYGDTGWRAIVEWDAAGEIITGAMPQNMVGKIKPSGTDSGGLYLRRIGNRVHGFLAGDTVLSASSVNFDTPLEYRPNGGRLKIASRDMVTHSPTAGMTPGVLFVGGLTYLLGLVVGMSAGGSAYTNAGTQWNYLCDRPWPTTASTYTPKNTTILP